MTCPRSATVLRSTAVLLVAVLVAACSSQPESQARASVIPPAPSGTAAAPASAAATETPTETPTETAASPDPTPGTAAGIPPKPAGVTFKKVGQTTDGGKTRVTYRVTWTSPEGVAKAFVVYGVNRCLRQGPSSRGKPCVVKGMRIPKETLVLIAEAPGALRTIDVAWTLPASGSGPYYAVLVRATNDAGASIFTIAWSDTV